MHDLSSEPLHSLLNLSIPNLSIWPNYRISCSWRNTWYLLPVVGPVPSSSMGLWSTILLGHSWQRAGSRIGDQSAEDCAFFAPSALRESLCAFPLPSTRFVCHPGHRNNSCCIACLDSPNASRCPQSCSTSPASASNKSCLSRVFSHAAALMHRS